LVELALAVTRTGEPTVEFAAGEVNVTPAHIGMQKISDAINSAGTLPLIFLVLSNNLSPRVGKAEARVSACDGSYDWLNHWFACREEP
jgi:hypothetical protein